MNPHLVALMRQPSPDIASGLANFHRPAEFQRTPELETMTGQVAAIARILQNNGVTVTYRYDGRNFSDGTFTFDHAAVFPVADQLYAFMPAANWPRHEELELDLPWIERFALLKWLPDHFDAVECRFDPGTVVQAPNGILIGFSRHEDARTNYAGASCLKFELERLGYNGKIVLVEYSGLHLSTFCTCISTLSLPAPVFLANAAQVDIEAVRQLGEVIEVKDAEAWRANAIAHPAMDTLILMKSWLDRKSVV